MSKNSEGIYSQGNAKRVRVFQFAQYVHDLDGNVLIDEDTIRLAILSHKTLKRAVYTLHDKDVFSEEDELRQKAFIASDVYTAADELENPNHKAGTQKRAKYRLVIKGQTKPKHYHVVGDLGNNATPIFRLANWFNVPEFLILQVIGRDGFIDCCEYLTHESETQQKLGKYLYPDSQICAFNFEFRELLNEAHAKKNKYGRKDIQLREQWIYDISQYGRSLSDCEQEDPILYMTNLNLLEKCRRVYLSKQLPPSVRVNLYVCGAGRIGKGTMCMALARRMYPGLPDKQVFFVVGGGNVTFDGYDGQPVIIWDDCRAVDLLHKMGSRERLFNAFNTFPQAQHRESVKYGDTFLLNAVNLVNSVQPYEQFLDSLAGEYTGRDGTYHVAEDKNQSYGRFPFIIPLRQDTFDFLVNRGCWYDNSEFTEYDIVRNIKGNIARLYQILPPNDDRRIIEDKLMALPVQKLTEYVQIKQTKDSVDDSVLQELDTWGEVDDLRTERENKLADLYRELGLLKSTVAGFRYDPDPEKQRQYELYIDGQNDKISVLEKQINDLESLMKNECIII